MSSKKAERSRRKRKRLPPAIMSKTDFAKLGTDEVSYIKRLTSEQAKQLFPDVKGLPQGIDLYALYTADGLPIQLSDSHAAVIGSAHAKELEVALVH